MMQPLDGSQPSNTQVAAGLPFLKNYISAGDYIDAAVAKLKDIRVPDYFQQRVNGQEPYNVAATPQNFV